MLSWFQGPVRGRAEAAPPLPHLLLLSLISPELSLVQVMLQLFVIPV